MPVPNPRPFQSVSSVLPGHTEPNLASEDFLLQPSSDLVLQQQKHHHQQQPQLQRCYPVIKLKDLLCDSAMLTSSESLGSSEYEHLVPRSSSAISQLESKLLRDSEEVDGELTITAEGEKCRILSSAQMDKTVDGFTPQRPGCNINNSSLARQRGLMNQSFGGACPLTAGQVDMLLCLAVSNGSHTDVINECKRALLASDLNNVVYNYLTAVKYTLHDVMDKLINRIRRNFLCIAQSEQFLSLQLEYLLVFLDDDCINVVNELDLFFVALSWVDYNKQERLPLAGQVLNKIRYVYIDPADIIKYVEPNAHLFTGDEGKRALLNVYRHRALIAAGLIAPPPSGQPSHKSRPGSRLWERKPEDDFSLPSGGTSGAGTSGRSYDASKDCRCLQRKRDAHSEMSSASPMAFREYGPQSSKTTMAVSDRRARQECQPDEMTSGRRSPAAFEPYPPRRRRVDEHVETETSCTLEAADIRRICEEECRKSIQRFCRDGGRRTRALEDLKVQDLEEEGLEYRSDRHRDSSSPPKAQKHKALSQDEEDRDRPRGSHEELDKRRKPRKKSWSNQQGESDPREHRSKDTAEDVIRVRRRSSNGGTSGVQKSDALAISDMEELAATELDVAHPEHMLEEDVEVEVLTDDFKTPIQSMADTHPTPFSPRNSLSTPEIRTSSEDHSKTGSVEGDRLSEVPEGSGLEAEQQELEAQAQETYGEDEIPTEPRSEDAESWTPQDERSGASMFTPSTQGESTEPAGDTETDQDGKNADQTEKDHEHDKNERRGDSYKKARQQKKTKAPNKPSVAASPRPKPKATTTMPRQANTPPKKSIARAGQPKRKQSMASPSGKKSPVPPPHQNVRSRHGSLKVSIPYIPYLNARKSVAEVEPKEPEGKVSATPSTSSKGPGGKGAVKGKNKGRHNIRPGLPTAMAYDLSSGKPLHLARRPYGSSRADPESARRHTHDQPDRWLDQFDQRLDRQPDHRSTHCSDHRTDHRSDHRTDYGADHRNDYRADHQPVGHNPQAQHSSNDNRPQHTFRIGLPSHHLKSEQPHRGRPSRHPEPQQKSRNYSDGRNDQNQPRGENRPSQHSGSDRHELQQSRAADRHRTKRIIKFDHKKQPCLADVAAPAAGKVVEWSRSSTPQNAQEKPLFFMVGGKPKFIINGRLIH